MLPDESNSPCREVTRALKASTFSDIAASFSEDVMISASSSRSCILRASSSSMATWMRFSWRSRSLFFINWTMLMTQVVNSKAITTKAGMSFRLFSCFCLNQTNKTNKKSCNPKASNDSSLLWQDISLSNFQNQISKIKISTNYISKSLENIFSVFFDSNVFFFEIILGNVFRSKLFLEVQGHLTT